MPQHRTLTALVVVSACLGLGLRAQVAETARPFVGQETAIEAFLREAKVVKYEDIPVGVTKPTRAWLEPGGPVESVAWKPLRPGMYKGFFESYKSEVAAYEIDKLLQLQMVPPTVERKLNGVSGAVVMWLPRMRMWRDLESQKPATREWNAQMVRMKMFDVYIGNIDRNAGNILVDENWMAYLIDHSRAFVLHNEPPPTFGMVDRALWDRIQALDEARLQEAVGRYIGRQAVRAMLKRRERMASAIKKMMTLRGERIFIP